MACITHRNLHVNTSLHMNSTRCSLFSLQLTSMASPSHFLYQLTRSEELNCRVLSKFKVWLWLMNACHFEWNHFLFVVRKKASKLLLRSGKSSILIASYTERSDPFAFFFIKLYLPFILEMFWESKPCANRCLHQWAQAIQNTQGQLIQDR